ncbi:hypothetical protein ACLBWZ_14285 [Brucellaceae bacterium C25G]
MKTSVLLLSYSILGAVNTPVHAQDATFIGNEETSGPFSSGTQTFYNNSKMNADTASGGSQFSGRPLH